MKKGVQYRVKFLMEYDTLKSLRENMIREQGEVMYDPMTGAPIDVPVEDLNKYPKYCSYPERAILPGKNEVGVSGSEAIPNGYCCYPIPMPQSKSGGLSYIFLPQDATIEFWDETKYNHLFKNALKLNKKEIPNYIDYYSKLFPYGSVFSFDISGLTYSSWMKHERDSKFGIFNWFFTDNERKEPYPKIKWTDPRNEWDKVVDEWGNVAQWATTVAFFILGFFTQGATWLIIAEIATEGTLGIITAQRDLEKGQNLSAAFNLIFGMTPFLKFNKFFTGIDQTAASSLVRSMRNAGLNPNSTPDEIIRWYVGLGEAEQKLWSKMVKAQEEFSEAKLKRVLGEGIENFKQHIKSNPDVLKNVYWIQKVNVKEISLNVLISLIDLLSEIFYGDKLNDEEKRKLTSIYNNSEKVSQQLANEVKLNVIANANKIKTILNSETSDSYVNNLTKDAVKNSLEYINTQNKKMVEDGGGTWVEYEGDETKPLADNQIDDETLKKLESEGYKREELLTKAEWDIAKFPKHINGTIYWRIKE